MFVLCAFVCCFANVYREMGAVDLAAALERCSGSLELLQQVCVWESQSVRICAHVQYLVRLLGFSCACACMRTCVYVVCVSKLPGWFLRM